MRPPADTSASTAFTGRLEAIPLFDLCQFLLLNRRTGTLTVVHGDQTVHIYFEKGGILDIMDEALRTGERILLAAVQWKEGSFSFDPTPPGIQKRVTDSTEAILLEAARTIDECRAIGGESKSGPSQEAIFHERQTFAGDLAEAFRAAVERDAHAPRRIDPRTVTSAARLESILSDLSRLDGTLVLRGSAGVIREAGSARAFTGDVTAEGLLDALDIPMPTNRETGNRRFQRNGAWFHVRYRRVGGDTQVLIAHLTTRLPDASAIGLDCAGLDPILDREGGLVLVSGMPRGMRSTMVAGWLGRSDRPLRGTTLWIEESPRFAWEALPGLARHVGEPHGVESKPALIEWSPERVVIDSMRVHATSELALELAEAGITTVAVTTGVTFGEAIDRMLNALTRCGVPDAGARLGAALTGWIGVIPLRHSKQAAPLCATQIRLADPSLAAILGRTLGGGHEIAEWIATRPPKRGLREEIERLEREGRIDAAVRDSIFSELRSLLA